MDSGQGLRIRPGVPSLWAVDRYLLSDQRRRWIRKKVHDEYNAFGSSGNQPHPRSVQELSSMKSVPGAKKIGDHWIRWSQQPSSLIVNVSVIWEAPRAPLSTPRSLVATRAWPLLWKLGNLVHTAYDLFMEHNWVFIFPLSLHV